MSPFHLVFPDEATGRAALAEALLLFTVNMDGEEREVKSANLAIRGRKRQPPVFDEDGPINPETGLKPLIAPSVLLDEWRCDLLAEELPASLAQYEVHPVTPDYEFFGFSPADIAAREAAEDQE